MPETMFIVRCPECGTEPRPCHCGQRCCSCYHNEDTPAPPKEEPSLKIPVSGKAYFACCDPRCSDVPKEESWPTPEMRKVGKGVQFIYEGTPELAEQIASHLESVGGSLAFYADAEDRPEGRACLAAARRIRKLIALRVSGQRNRFEL